MSSVVITPALPAWWATMALPNVRVASRWKSAHFEQLGLSKADIYNSPMLRTAQTAAYMFNKVGTGEDWLISCKGTMLRDALAHKVAGRNLILVTHSECMEQLEKDLKLSGSTQAMALRCSFPPKPHRHLAC
jgi:phosphohistidine phosphatase SixA